MKRRRHHRGEFHRHALRMPDTIDKPILGQAPGSSPGLTRHPQQGYPIHEEPTRPAPDRHRQAEAEIGRSRHERAAARLSRWQSAGLVYSEQDQTVSSALRYARHYLAGFDVDATAVGPLVAEGKQHYTYRYRHDKVIKIPKQTIYMNAYGMFTYQDIISELKLLRQYLDDFIVETQVLQNDAHSGYVILQEFLHDFEFVTQSNFPFVEHDFVQIVEANQAVIQAHGLSLDLLGNKGLQRSFAASLLRRRELALMNNLLVIRQAGVYTVRIVDFNLLQLGPRENTSLFRRSIDYCVFGLSRYLLNDNFRLGI